MTFNLDPPNGFRGLDPGLPLRIYSRNLPHWRQEGATYFVTFNLKDGIPVAKRKELQHERQLWEKANPPPRSDEVWTDWARRLFKITQSLLDEGHGSCWFRKPDYAAELHRAILHFHEERYHVGCFVIMANHCHLVIRPFPSIRLEDEIGSIKSVTSRFINRNETQIGEVWLQEAFDRIVRDDEHLYRVVQYIGANPRKAGLPRERWIRWMNPEWIQQGWNFVDS